MKKVIYTILLVLIICVPCLISAEESNVELVSNQEYFDKVHSILFNAKESIYVSMYYVDFRRNEPDSTVSILVNDLVRAKQRGLLVKVILDQTIVFKGDRLIGRDYERVGKNQRAFNYLRSNDIDVKFDKLEIYTHEKCVVVDGRIVILGSHNWSKNALTRSNEKTVIINSEALAKELIAEFNKIQIDHVASAKEPEEYKVFNNDIMTNTLSDFVSHSSDYYWDVYMYLVGSYESGMEIDFDYDKVAEYFGLNKKMDREKYREMLGYHTLKKLQDKYKLLKYTPIRGQNAKAVLEPYANEDKEYFEIPVSFWEYQWNKRLTLSGQYCFFINLIEGGTDREMWMLSKKRLVDKYKVGKERISEGMAELRHWNLLEIVYGDIDYDKGYEGRLPNRYQLKQLYRLEDFESELDKLYGKYGIDKVEQARGYAKIVYVENNLVDVEEIVNMINVYGLQKVHNAFDIVKKKSEDNPKRSIAYVKGILQKEVIKK